MRRITAIRWTLPFSALAALASAGFAASNLIENSPFAPLDGAGRAAASAAMPLELRSILKEGSRFQFSLYDLAGKQSTWVGLNEPGHEFLVKTFDQTHDSVTVEDRGRTYTLALKEATIAAMGPGAAPDAGPSGSQPPGAAVYHAGGGPLPNNPSIERRIQREREAFAAARRAELEAQERAASSH